MQLQLNPQLLLQLNGGTGSQNVIQNLVAISSEHFGDLMGTLLHKNKFIIPKKMSFNWNWGWGDIQVDL